MGQQYTHLQKGSLASSIFNPNKIKILFSNIDSHSALEIFCLLYNCFIVSSAILFVNHHHLRYQQCLPYHCFLFHFQDSFSIEVWVKSTVNSPHLRLVLYLVSLLFFFYFVLEVSITFDIVLFLSYQMDFFFYCHYISLCVL
jgi:hypothetical protein